MCYEEIANWKCDGSSRQLLIRTGRRHLMLYAELGKLFPNNHKYALYPKHHLWQHLLEDDTVNPRLEWNYSDEDEIGQAATFAKATNSQFFETAFIERYVITWQK